MTGRFFSSKHYLNILGGKKGKTLRENKLSPRNGIYLVNEIPNRKLASWFHNPPVCVFSVLCFPKSGLNQREASPSISHPSFSLLFSLSVSDVRQAHARKQLLKKLKCSSAITIDCAKTHQRNPSSLTSPSAAPETHRSFFGHILLGLSRSVSFGLIFPSVNPLILNNRVTAVTSCWWWALCDDSSLRLCVYDACLSLICTCARCWEEHTRHDVRLWTNINIL